MDLFERALTHLQPPYAGWVAPLVLDNIHKLTMHVKAHLETGSALDVEASIGLLDEVRGGFWSLGMEAARALTAQVTGFLRDPSSAQMAGEHLLWALGWLDDAALVADMGYLPSPAPLIDLMRQWGGQDLDDPRLLSPAQHSLLPLGASMEHKAAELATMLGGSLPAVLPDDPSDRACALLAHAAKLGYSKQMEQAHPGLDLERHVRGVYRVPSARAFLEMAQAVAQESMGVRELLDAWGAADEPGAGQLGEALARLGDLETVLKTLHPDLAGAVGQARDRVAKVAYDPGLEASQARGLLVEAGSWMVELEQVFLDVVVGGMAKRKQGIPRQAARAALGELAQGVGQEAIQARAIVGQGAQGDGAQALGRISGALAMLGAPGMAGQAGALFQDPSQQVQAEVAAGIISMAEAWGHAAFTHCPHVHALESHSQDSAGLLEETRFYLDRAGHAHQALAAVLGQWDSIARTQAGIAMRRVFQQLERLQAPAGHPMPRMGAAGRALLDKALSSLQGPGEEVRQAVQDACERLGEAKDMEFLPADFFDQAIFGLEHGARSSSQGERRAKTGKPAVAAEAGRAQAPLALADAQAQWATLAQGSQAAFREFFGPQWHVLSRPDHPDFWVALGLVRSGLWMMGADHAAGMLDTAIQQREIDDHARTCLSWLAEDEAAHGTQVPAERMLGLLEENIRLAKQAMTRDDAPLLDLLLQEQARLLQEYGYLSPP